MHVFELPAQPAEMIPCRRLDAVVKVALFVNPQTRDDFHHMQQGDLAIAFARQPGCDFDGLLMRIR
jgi:hypothetical protein